MPVIDPEEPALSRVYNTALGRFMNTEADRAVEQGLTDLVPDYRTFVRENRSGLRRAVEACVRGGTTQFIDFGCGMPANPNVHEIACRLAPESRVVYVDNDPVAACAFSEYLSKFETRDGCGAFGVLEADVRRVEAVVNSDVVGRVLDLDRPLALLAFAVIHCITDDDEAMNVLRRYHDYLEPGTIFCASHPCGDNLEPAVLEKAIAHLAERGITLVSRGLEQFASILGPWSPDDEGIKKLHLWRPEPGIQSGDINSLGLAVMAFSTRSVSP
jgi:hypothetical protein